MALQLASISAQRNHLLHCQSKRPLNTRPPAGVSGGDYSGISRQFGCAVETPDTVDLGGDDTAKKRPDSRDALQQLFLCALTLADRSIKLFDLGFEQLGSFQILLQQWLILMSW